MGSESTEYGRNGQPTDEGDVRKLAEHLFRHEAGKLVSIVAGIYGAGHLQMAEDVVQEAMIRALRSWPVGGIPANPTAWLLRTAKNLAIDQMRREKNFLSKEAAIVTEMEVRSGEEMEEKSDVADDQLQLMFVCCHPKLPQETQVALALKTLCGFSPAEIASAFLISEVAVSKRLVRARQRIRDEGIPFRIPSSDELPLRLNGVLKTIYLLFNEGHKASHGEEVVRAGFCHEALRLGSLLCQHPVGNRPHTHALMALMAFTASRIPARTDSDGTLLRLEEQERGKWDRHLIQAGMIHFAKSSQGNEAGEYHLQAGIAACHALSANDAETDWPRILRLYNLLLETNPSPVIALNRAVAVAKVHGAETAIRTLDSPDIRGSLENYYLFHATLGELELKRSRHETAANHFRKALDITATSQERALLVRRLGECLNGGRGV